MKDIVLCNDPTKAMLDIAHQIPGEMQDYDKSSTKSPEDLGGRIQRYWQLTLQLDEWKVDMDLTCIPMAYQTRVATWPMSFAESACIFAILSGRLQRIYASTRSVTMLHK